MDIANQNWMKELKKIPRVSKKKTAILNAEVGTTVFVGFKKNSVGLFQEIDFDFVRENVFRAQKPRGTDKVETVKEVQTIQPNQFALAISVFSRDMNAYVQGTSIVDLMIPVFTSVAIQNNPYKFVVSKGRKTNKKDTELFELNTDHFGGFHDSLKKSTQWQSFLNFLPRMTLTSIVSTYDGYLGNLISALYSTVPELLIASEKKLAISDVLAYNSISELKQQLIRKEVETIIRDSHEDQFDWLERKLGIKLKKDLSVWPEFIEICERRNLLTHTNGIVSQQYLDKCRSVCFKIEPNTKVGDRLFVSRKYLSNAAAVFYEMGIKLGHIVWRKVQKSEPTASEKSFSEICFELIKTKNYTLANRLLEFGTKMPRLDEVYQRMMTINYANSMKLSGKPEKIDEILDGLNWKTCSPDYKICVAAVRGKNEEVFRLMKSMGKTGEISKEGYLTWPVFLPLRKEVKFREIYFEVFGSAYETDELIIDSHVVISDSKVMKTTTPKKKKSDLSKLN